MLDKGIYRVPESLFAWALEYYPKVDHDQFSPTSFAFELFDRISQTDDSEKVMKQVVSYAGILGIKPWENVSSLRHQASTCLAEYLTGCLGNSS